VLGDGGPDRDTDQQRVGSEAVSTRDLVTSSLAVAAVLSLAACGGGDPAGGDADPGPAGLGDRVGDADAVAAPAAEERTETVASAPGQESDYGEAADVFTNYVPPDGAIWIEIRRDDGGLEARGWVVDPDGSHVPVGPHRTRHPDGTPASEGSYDEDGMRQGYWHYWHDNGRLAEEGFYVDGELDRSRFWVRRDRDGNWLGGSNPPSASEVSL